MHQLKSSCRGVQCRPARASEGLCVNILQYQSEAPSARRIMGYCIRRMHVEDIPQLVSIDREAFPTQWPPTSFKRELSNKLAHYLVAYQNKDDSLSVPAQAPEPPDKGTLGKIADKVREVVTLGNSRKDELPSVRNIAGYVALWMMADEAHIISIAVRQAHLNQGIGELLLISAIDLATEHNALVVTLEVRASNHPAQALYEKYGFCRVGERRAYYSDNKEDAVIMTTDAIASESYRSRLQQLKQDYAQKRECVLSAEIKQRFLESHTY